MAYVLVAPEVMAAAAGNLAGIGSAIRQANAVAAASTTQVAVAASDEVSAAISALFGSYGHEFQALSAQTALFHDQFVQTLTSGGGAYAAAKPPTRRHCRHCSKTCWGDQYAHQLLVQPPLIGNGTNGAAGPGKQVGGRVLNRQRRPR